ncbi:MAG TPA: aldose 1-epimerase [Caldimonas sp.]|nr:aldose 1-epimerase [Caldimonas sp.]
MIERIACAGLVADIAPAIGGSLVSFFREAAGHAPRRDWLRDGSAAAARGGDAFEMASFPLVPWCNRIRDGRFTWNGRTVQLPPNRPNSRHPLHGIGWQRAWRVTARGDGHVDIAFEDDGRGPWPYPFAARQRYAIDPAGLDITLAVTNTGAQTMPAGLAHHPYIRHRREGTGTLVRTDVAAVWLADRDVLPTALSTTHPAIEALRRGMRLADFDLDNNFTGFSHRVDVTWPDGSGLRLLGGPPLDFFVLYCPTDKDIAAIEAVSNTTDWVNLRDSQPRETIGGAALAPGETLEVRTRFEPDTAGDD